MFCDQIISQIAAKKGGRSIHDKNILEDGSDTLCNTKSWLLWLCGLMGSLTVNEFFSVLYAVACLEQVSIAKTWEYSAKVLQKQHSFKKVQAQLALIVIA